MITATAVTEVGFGALPGSYVRIEYFMGNFLLLGDRKRGYTRKGFGRQYAVMLW